MAKRPGRTPTDLRKLDCKLEFPTEVHGQRVRDLGGGAFVLNVVLAALDSLPQNPISAEAEVGQDAVEVRVSIPLERLRQQD